MNTARAFHLRISSFDVRAGTLRNYYVPMEAIHMNLSQIEIKCGLDARTKDQEDIKNIWF